MPWTEAERDALKKAIARGEKSVQYADRRVDYPDVSGMVEALRLIEAELSTSSGSPRPRQHLGYAGGKGV